MGREGGSVTVREKPVTRFRQTLRIQIGFPEAAALTAGFGASATKTEMLAAISAGSSLDKARKARATTFEPAYEAALQTVVKDALGATSTEYKRIHVRAPAANEIEAAPPSVPT